MEKRNYVVDEFADLRILHFFVDDFDKLNLNQKLYVYYLSEAAKWGRDIIWDQKNKENLFIRKVLETIIETFNGEKGKEYNAFLVYAKRIFFSNGMHHHYSNDKIIPNVSQEYFKFLLENSNQQYCNIDEIINILYKEENSKGDLIEDAHTNFYENVGEEEAIHYYKGKFNKEEDEPISYGLNSKLKKENNQLIEEVYKIDGLYDKYIKNIVLNLKKALKYTENEDQKEYTKKLIKFYETGDLKTWDQYNILWTKTDNGLIDYVNGFVEVYDDPIKIKGSYEAIVNIKDVEETKITKIIADNAFWFENHSPVDERFKKKEVVGISAKVINAITLAGDCYPSAPIGINLPNATWIREKYGSKSVSISNLVKSVSNANLELIDEVKLEFYYDKEINKKREQYEIMADELHTHLHECLGHASHQLLKGVSASSLRDVHSTIEEVRADLFSLYYLADEKLIELDIIKELDVAKYYYEKYIRNGLLVQLSRIELGKNVIESHMQARKLISEIAFELGKNENIIEKKLKDNKTYFVVNDYLKLREIFGKMLKEIQRITSEGDYQKAKDLINKYAVKIDYDLHKEVLERYQKLNLKPYSGYINPNLTKIKKNGEVKDVQISYPNDFLKQHLEYGKHYSF